MTRLLYIFVLALLPLLTSAQWLDFSKSSIFCSDKKNIQLFRATTVLQEELLLHTRIKSAIAGKLDSKDFPQIVICLEKDAVKLPARITTGLNSLPPTGKDGYKIALIDAKIWVSPQAFKPSTVWYANFFAHINKKPDWLGGVVYGQWIKMPLPEVRRVTDPSIPIRLYPDITHSYSCQYPVPEWDLAFAMTLGRECINPRPTDEKLIHNRYASLAQGSISYSEGTNDDVNKFIRTGQDWDPETPVIETLRDYARYFI